MENIEQILTANENINSECIKHWERQSQLRKNMCEAINAMCGAMGGEVLSDFDSDKYPPCVTYDGGNHPEYASTISSVVTAVRSVEINGVKTFEVDLDEEEGYSEDRLNFNDVSEIFDFIEANFGDFLEEN